MAKSISIELDKTISDIVAKNFKLGTGGDKIASSIINGLINKMIFGDDTDRKKLITMLVPDILSSTDALKLYTNIIKYKEKEIEKLEELMQGDFSKTDEKKENKKSLPNNNLNKTNNTSTHQAIASDRDL